MKKTISILTAFIIALSANAQLNPHPATRAQLRQNALFMTGSVEQAQQKAGIYGDSVLYGSSGGSVSSVSSGNCSPLFTAAVATATTTPALSFTLSSAANNTILGNVSGGAHVPVYFTPVLASTLFAAQGTPTTILHGCGAGSPSWSAVNLGTDVTGTLPGLTQGTGISVFTYNARATIIKIR